MLECRLSEKKVASQFTPCWSEDYQKMASHFTPSWNEGFPPKKKRHRTLLHVGLQVIIHSASHFAPRWNEASQKKWHRTSVHVGMKGVKKSASDFPSCWNVGSQKKWHRTLPMLEAFAGGIALRGTISWAGSSFSPRFCRRDNYHPEINIYYYILLGEIPNCPAQGGRRWWDERFA